ncbi:Lipoprotein-anchoring transpeptidase ErfK/SrfK [Friedmanniella luteola]|uniref:Lipoprotein-anchoring transpeptidase ErfK/SrfK n=1 Tax=Friedmanniella luteola TaxID=546871 RepID=A0A1H1N498_9ACTN|nr:Ig-like domain-containing protein [Friedmanniella luteola]SDR93794.1 Lipoprotein-anchoring transpeptidase ErfK/SrfK [Friedmanniella luteola]
MPTSTRTLLNGLVGTVLLATVVAGCSGLPTGQAGGTSSSAPTAPTGSSRPSATEDATQPPAPRPVALKANVADDASKVAVDTRVKVQASDGTVQKVKLSYRGVDAKGAATQGTVKGEVSEDGRTWTAADRLEPSATYTLAMTGANAADEKTTRKSTFSTQELTLAEQTFPTLYPLPDSKVGVGMPVVLTFDVPVTDKAAFEENLHVTSKPAQEGSWSWLSSTQVRFRPKAYWKPGTKVTVRADVNGVDAGDGIYGQTSTSTSFTVGRSLVTKVDLKRDVATVYRDGQKVRTILVSGGKPGWETRSGTKLIMAKEFNKKMTNEMIGAEEDYTLVAKYALRITNSGEFLHSAPWNAGNLGRRNASHGCVGMSTADSQWLYENTLIGDPVVTTGSGRGLEQGNGYADWDISYAKFQKGSAL